MTPEANSERLPVYHKETITPPPRKKATISLPDNNNKGMTRPSCPQPKNTANRMMVRMTVKMISKQHALLRAFFWYLAALRSSRSAPRVSSRTFSTLLAMVSSTSPCSVTIWATCWNSTLRSPTPCSMLRISSSRSMMSASWKSTSSCGASRASSCCCCCCCSWRSCGLTGPPAPAPAPAAASCSTAARAAETEAFCFSRACRWRDWNSERED
ncbi:hypothetical protein VTG60DRAFT_857 [Thermothelomyces hinnuleus]